MAGALPGVADLMWIEPREIGPALADHHGHAGLALEIALLRRVVAGMGHVELHVGRFEARPRAHEAVDDAGRQRRARRGRLCSSA